MSTEADDYDSPWKEALGEYLREALALLFPEVHDGIDWTRPHEFLDGELQQVMRDAASGRRYVDRLVRVYLPGGGDVWLLIHIEVQSQKDEGFPERMFVYFARLRDRYGRPVLGLAVLADENARWRPDTFESELLWGSGVRYHYLVAKLRDWRARRDELEASDNPFAVVVQAHLAARRTRRDTAARERAKLGLIRRLYVRGYSRERVLSLLRFIDWLLALPAEAEERVQQAIVAIEEERKMPYVATYERMAIERGHAQGLEQGMQQGLEQGMQQGLEQGRQQALLETRREDILRIVRARFGQAPKALELRIRAADEATLDALLVRAATVAAVDGL